MAVQIEGYALTKGGLTGRNGRGVDVFFTAVISAPATATGEPRAVLGGGEGEGACVCVCACVSVSVCICVSVCLCVSVRIFPSPVFPLPFPMTPPHPSPLPAFLFSAATWNNSSSPSWGSSVLAGHQVGAVVEISGATAQVEVTTAISFVSIEQVKDSEVR